jgi:E3 ubiquitin-protein ligase SHPRH
MRRSSHHIQQACDLHALHACRRVLNVKYLTSIIQCNLNIRAATERSSRSKGKKRALEDELSPEYQPPAKRFRRAAQGISDEDDTLHEEPLVSYLAYHHTLQLQFTRSVEQNNLRFDDDNQKAEVRDWLQDEKDLCALVEKAGVSADGLTIDLGEVFLSHERASISLFHDNKMLTTLPELDFKFSLKDHDIRSTQVRNVLVAFLVLQDAGRAEVTTTLQAFLAPGSSTNTYDELPVRLDVNISVSFISPRIFEPFLYTTKLANAQAEDAQRRALCYIFPRSSQLQSSVSRHIDIPFLYSALSPAPPVKAPAHETAFQPGALRPALLPFQRRSTAWLLSRQQQDRRR